MRVGGAAVPALKPVASITPAGILNQSSGAEGAQSFSVIRPSMARRELIGGGGDERANHRRNQKQRNRQSQTIQCLKPSLVHLKLDPAS